MIPVTHPHSTLVRTSDPYSLLKGVRTRKLRDGTRKRYPLRITFVPVLCPCGKRYGVSLRDWLYRTPRSCNACAGAKRRKAPHSCGCHYRAVKFGQCPHYTLSGKPRRPVQKGRAA